jgi:hypothetical protein
MRALRGAYCVKPPSLGTCWNRFRIEAGVWDCSSKSHARSRAVSGWDVQLCFVGTAGAGRSSVAGGTAADGQGFGVAERGDGKLYADSGRPSIAPEYILRALLLQVFYSVRSERLLVEQIDYNLLFRWFVGLGSRRHRSRLCCESSSATPRLGSAAVDGEVFVGHEPLPLPVDLGEEPLRHRAGQQSVPILREHCMVPHRVIHYKL